MIYSSWDIEQNKLKLVILGHFLPFIPLKTPKIKILKNEKICWRYHHFTHVYQKSQSYDVRFLRYRVRQAEFFVILGHFLPFQPPDNLENQNFKIEKNTWRYYHFTNLHHKWQSYDAWFLRFEVQQTEFFVILDHFLPFYPPMDPENQNFEKMKKTPEDIIILQMCTINDSHMMYGSWDMECNRQNFLSFWTVFCPFTPLWTQKIKIFQKWKKTPADIIILQMCTMNDSHMMTYGSWDRTISCTFYPSNNPKNQNFRKMKKTPGDIIILYTCTIDDNHMMYGSWDIENNRKNFLSFWTIFCPFTPITNQKIKILKKWEKAWRYYHFTNVYHKW